MTPSGFEADLVVVAPHLDDAVFSCGARIARARGNGERVLVATVFTAGPAPDATMSLLASQLLRTWGLDHNDAYEARRQEDLSAARVLGFEALHLACSEALFRTHDGEHLYDGVASLFGEIDPRDAITEEQVASALEALPEAQRVLLPKGVGRHVDHQIVRSAGLRLAAEQAGNAARSEWGLYEEYPYVRGLRSQWRARLADFRLRGRRDVLEPTAEELDLKVQAMLTYSSQITSAFDDREDLRAQTTAFDQRYGERVLWLAPTT